MILVNDAKMACMKCIRGHRSSSCKHGDRELHPIRPRGRPISQCEKCRQARIKRHIHVKCTCSSNTEKRQPILKKARSIIPETDATPPVSTNSDPPPSSCCEGRHSHAPLPFLMPSESTTSDSDGFPHTSSIKSESPSSFYVPNQHPYHYSGAGFYSHPKVPRCHYKDFYHNSHHIPSPQWYSNCNNHRIHANVHPFQTPNILANDTSGLQYEINSFQGFSLDQQREMTPDFPESSAFKVLSNSQDSIAAAAASHDLYPQPNSPYPFAMLDDGSYVPLNHDQPSHSPIYSPPNPLNGIKPESGSSIPSHNFPIQLSDYFTIPSSCARGSSHCKCDENCQCLGCLTHLNNPTTLAALNHISALQEEHRDPGLSHSFIEDKLLLDNLDDGKPDDYLIQHDSDNQQSIQYPLNNPCLTPELL
ncbi:DNA-binding transcription factor, nutritional copper sensing Cuf1 [Schizosaccharomyces osmophilus]|uniref:DNA-binding transcription factor, nutritional copper sensing Cuf1 n=1 Tax=Schizosaccharomyces osmophilus TaxID=2545709 RepID=A0AAE9W9Z2_9SCHI|nr:DNA-binding transcription factor, nutritional copper sensing Cuf1 [Schizosaccharomyces osmophilus]WBW71919.1 DNA-binding transcription factor, nutritional copper sensing Cuf1 [Schizosaccharomyces osmophilus]